MARTGSGSGGTLFNRTATMNFSEDCDMLFFCEKNAQTYRLCYRGAPLNSKRCSPSEKNLMLMFCEVVHRASLIDDTVKSLESRIASLSSEKNQAPHHERSEVSRFEQSQAASLIASGLASQESTSLGDMFSSDYPVASAKPARDRVLQRRDNEKQTAEEPPGEPL